VVSMPYVLTPQLMDIVQEKVASGRYQSEEQVLTTALELLEDHDSSVAAVKEGLEDLAAGRVRSLEEADAEFYAKYQIPLDDE
jgi:putative addiction module CopG family antidote